MDILLVQILFLKWDMNTRSLIPNLFKNAFSVKWLLYIKVWQFVFISHNAGKGKD